MNLATPFATHIQILQQRLETALQAQQLDGVVISAGIPHVYFADDHEAHFQAVPHFAHWCPQPGPYHFLALQPGKKPKLIRWSPQDYWEEHVRPQDAYWCTAFDILDVPDRRTSWQALPTSGRWAYIGPETAMAQEWGFFVENPLLVSQLDWDRGVKTPYEIICLKEATRLSAQGHRAAKAAFEAGSSELDIHFAYLQAVGCGETDLPYTAIVALNEKAAILHYQYKRKEPRKGNVLLLDAGASYQRYGSDITRTYCSSAAPTEFQGILSGMAKIQQRACQNVRAGTSFLELHHQVHVEIGALLVDSQILRNCSPEDAVTSGKTAIFLPHGLGHMLGIQVHDVGGLQKNALGEPEKRSTHYPRLRTLRSLREGEVVTIEPGFYFIPMLLEKARKEDTAEQFNWTLIDQLRSCGGIRIEDNVHVTADGHENLTREYLP
jgi:Xaa-Pro dipeptidase